MLFFSLLLYFLIIFVRFFAMAVQVVELIASQKRSKRTGTKSGYYAKLNGYLFTNTKSRMTVSFGLRHYWKCKNCNACMTTDDNDEVIVVGKHSCEQSMREVILLICLNIHCFNFR